MSEPLTRTIKGVSTSITAFIGRALKGPVNKATMIHSFTDYERIFGGLWKESSMSYAVYHYFLNGGKDAIIVRVHNKFDLRTGIHTLESVDLFNLLCIPAEDNDYSETGGAMYSQVYGEALAYCEKRHAMLIVDPPSDWKDVETAKKGVNNLGLVRHQNAAIYFPYIRASDPLEGDRFREFVPCGAVAGVIARTDSQYGVWKSPAGMEAKLVGVLDLAIRLTDAEQGELNPLGINCLRILPSIGCVVWGARTMRGANSLADQWKYLAVRRMALFIEESLYRGTRWVTFEPSDEKLWARIRLNVGVFMQGLFRKGAFQGTVPTTAYFVKCDNETTTQLDIDRGIVNIVVGFAPLKPAEFVILNIQQIAGQERERNATV